LRLTEKGLAWGCVGAVRAAAFAAHKAVATASLERGRREGGSSSELARQGLNVRTDGRWRSVLELLGNDSVPFEALAGVFPWLRDIPQRALGQLRTEARYAGYLPRQQADIRAFRRQETVPLAGVRFQDIGGLSGELLGKLAQVQPASLGAAARIQGMTPAALAAIAAHARKHRAA